VKKDGGKGKGEGGREEGVVVDIGAAITIAGDWYIQERIAAEGRRKTQIRNQSRADKRW